MEVMSVNLLKGIKILILSNNPFPIWEHFYIFVEKLSSIESYC